MPFTTFTSATQAACGGIWVKRPLISENLKLFTISKTRPMRRTAVINVVGLSPSLIGSSTPAIAAYARGGTLATIEPAFPAVTCTAQANYLTGRPPAEHGIVGNGWYDRALAEVHFWKQS